MTDNPGSRSTRPRRVWRLNNRTVKTRNFPVFGNRRFLIWRPAALQNRFIAPIFGIDATENVIMQIEALMAVAGALLLVSVFANRISTFSEFPACWFYCRRYVGRQ